jgi:homoserine kinase
MRVAVRVPATAANLGPGFDCFGLALELWNEVVADTDGDPAVVVEGEGAGELPEDASNLVFRSMAYLAREAGGSLPKVSLHSRNAIPLERGLGSSAAAVVAGLILADHLLGTNLPPDRVLEVAVDIEGHPDNVAACLRGGLVLAYLSGNGWRAERLDPHPELRPVLLIPNDERLPTSDARRVLPRQVALTDAVFNASRAALAIVALTQRPELLAVALEERIHQQRRLDLAPGSRALFQDLVDAGVPACVSGAGPAILAFEEAGGKLPQLGPSWRVERVGVSTEGARLQVEKE